MSSKKIKAETARFIEENIPDFHARRLENLGNLKLKKVLKRKNPYLFKAKNINTAADLIRGVLDAYLSSQEETIFGDFLEKVAIFVCNTAFGGNKAPSLGMDLDFQRDGKRYIVSVKSGPNWGNSRQIAKMRDDFKTARRILGASKGKINVVSVNGCCYGKERQEDKGDYLKVCGERFWELISDVPGLYLQLIEPLGHKAKERNDAFQIEYGKVANRFVKEFIDEFCTSDGLIDWPKLVRFNSGALG